MCAAIGPLKQRKKRREQSAKSDCNIGLVSSFSHAKFRKLSVKKTLNFDVMLSRLLVRTFIFLKMMETKYLISKTLNHLGPFSIESFL